MKGKNTTKDVNVFPDELAFACFFCKCNLQQRVVHTAHTVNPFKKILFWPLISKDIGFSLISCKVCFSKLQQIKYGKQNLDKYVLVGS